MDSLAELLLSRYSPTAAHTDNTRGSALGLDALGELLVARIDAESSIPAVTQSTPAQSDGFQSLALLVGGQPLSKDYHAEKPEKVYSSSPEMEATLLRHVRMQLASMTTSRSEDDRLYRLALISAFLNKPGQEKKFSNARLGKAMGVHPDTIKTAENIISQNALQDIPHLVMHSQRARRVDRFDHDGSPIKNLALDYVLCESRDSPDPDDVLTIRINGKKYVVSCRYLALKRKELYFQFIRDMGRMYVAQNPSLKLNSYRIVSETIFLGWLREWKWIKNEEWYVCICALCFNVEQYVKAYSKLTRRIHCRPRQRTLALPPVRRNAQASTPVEPQDICTVSDSDSGDSSDSERYSSTPECSLSLCMDTPMRRPTVAEIPTPSGSHRFHASRFVLAFEYFPMCSSFRYERTPTAIALMTSEGVMCPDFNNEERFFAGQACAKGTCTRCGPRLSFARHACAREIDDTKFVSIKTIAHFENDGHHAASRPHFTTRKVDRKSFLEEYTTILTSFASHFFLARHQRRVLKYLASTGLKNMGAGPSRSNVSSTSCVASTSTVTLSSFPNENRPVTSTTTDPGSGACATLQGSQPTATPVPPSISAGFPSTSPGSTFAALGALTILSMCVSLLVQVDFSEKFRHTTNWQLTGQQFKATEVPTWARFASHFPQHLVS
jgi:hypothetical protein